MPLWHTLTVSDAVAVTTPQIFSSTLKTHLGLHLPWECTGPVLHTLGTCFGFGQQGAAGPVAPAHQALTSFAAAAPLLLCCLSSTGPWLGINKLPL